MSIEPAIQRACTHPAHRMLHHAPVPCPECRGWLDRDGTVLSTDAMVERYPHLRPNIAATPRQELPDYEPTTGDRLGGLVALTGAIARTLLMVIVAGAALVILIVILTHA